MSLSFHAAPMLTHQSTRFTLFGEALEDRCLLSADSPLNFAIQTAEIYGGRAYSSQLVEPSVNQSQQGVVLTDVLADGASVQLSTDLTPTVQPGDADSGSDNDQIAPLVAVPPDDSIGPFVGCPGLDEDFCLPGEIDIDLDIDFLDALIFGSATSAETSLGSSFDTADRVGRSDFLFLGARQFGLR